jgi:hypothetical protein
MQREFLTQYRKEHSNRPTVYWWHKNFIATGCFVLHAKSTGRPCVSDTSVEQIWESFVWSPRKSTWRACRETGIPVVTDKVVCKEFCVQMFRRIQDERFLDSVIFGGESACSNMLRQLLIPQLEEDNQDGHIHFQQDGCSPSLPLRSARVPQHLFPMPVDRKRGANTMATSFPGSYTLGFFLMGIC